jgi:hypothetical protein
MLDALRFSGRDVGPMKAPDGTMISPTGKSFDLDFYTVAKWDNGQIVEENLMYDLVTFMKQIGLVSKPRVGAAGVGNRALASWGCWTSFCNGRPTCASPELEEHPRRDRAG